MQISVKFSHKRGTADELEVQWQNGQRGTGKGKIWELEMKLLIGLGYRLGFPFFIFPFFCARSPLPVLLISSQN